MTVKPHSHESDVFIRPRRLNHAIIIRPLDQKFSFFTFNTNTVIELL